MAGLNYCHRKLLIFNISRLINKNSILYQPSRNRHHLIFQISSPHNRTVIQKSRLLFNKNHQILFRLASTNVNSPKETNSTIANTENGEISQSVEVKNDTTGVESSSVSVDESLIPPAPISEPEEIPVLEFVSTGLKEPSFESLGLGSYWPSGLFQSVLEYVHINLDLPWWQTIIVVTIALRLLMFPVNVSVTKNTINMTNNFPMITKLQQQITDARTSGDFYAAAALTQEFQNFVRDKKINMASSLKTVLIQGPVFLSMYYGLKGMCNAPVESLKTDGLFWFTDLTMKDPYYVLPVVLSLTLFAVLELGAESQPAKFNKHVIKWVLRGIPLLICVVSTQFPSCITFYWTVSNIIVLLQVSLLKIPAVAEFLKIPKRIKHDQSLVKGKGFLEGFKEGIRNAKLQSQIQERQRLNLVSFQKAGSGAVPRTFKRNPLLQKEKK